jgi:hypothetical protein
MRGLAVLALPALLLAFPAAAEERSIYDDVKLEVIPETNGVDPFPNELVLLRIRGVYRPLINIAHLVQPSLVNFGWTNLTRDTTFETEFDGFPARGFERTLAIFPEKPGELEIGSFTHKLTVVDGSGYRLIEVRSPPIKLKVAEWKGPGGPKDPNRWWLPSSEVRVIDHWSGDPNRVPRGETVRRTVTIEADGVTAEQLPPPPVMRSAGVISFRGPVDRETRVTETGPVARAVYRWDMRPTTARAPVCPRCRRARSSRSISPLGFATRPAYGRRSRASPAPTASGCAPGPAPRRCGRDWPSSTGTCLMRAARRGRTCGGSRGRSTWRGERRSRPRARAAPASRRSTDRRAPPEAQTARPRPRIASTLQGPGPAKTR